MKRLWVALPILLALLLAIVLIPKVSPSSLDAARARWDARTFTRYRMNAIYYEDSGNCTQDISVEGNEVTEVHNATTCPTALPLPGIEYPTITDILDYLQAKAEEYEANRVCASEECRCDIPEAPIAQFEPEGYPREAYLHPIFEARMRSGFFYSVPSCTEFHYSWSSIEVLSVTPEQTRDHVMKRLWIALPILLALLLAIVLIPRTEPSSFEAARARWDARPFTNYRMLARYYQNSGNCMQEISVEGNEVTEVHNSTTCNTPLPELVEYPTVSDIFNYLQAQNDEFEATKDCESEECLCDIPMGAVARYDILGYPRYTEVRPIWEMMRRHSVFAPISSCNSFGYEWSSIEIVRVTPE